MMADYFQIIVDRDVSCAEAEHVGRDAIAWMADELVIEEEPSTCVPDGRRGFRPAQLWQSAIVEIDEFFLGMSINGVEVSSGRQVFDAGVYEPTPHCPQCHAMLRSDTSDRPKSARSPHGSAWKAAVDAWVCGDDDAVLECPACELTSSIVEWRHDPPIGFGNLGLVFWNWPSLNREFISRLERRLGHRLMLVEGKRAP